MTVFVTSQWVDRTATCVRGDRVVPQCGRTLTACTARVEESA